MQLTLDDGRTLDVQDTGTGTRPVIWHPGTPNVGGAPEPLFPVSDPLGIRWISYSRPGYGGSTPQPGRTVASAAADVAAIADALGLDRFAVAGHSGGGPHALACGALLGSRVTAVLSVSALSPYDGSDGWFDGMAAPTSASLRAAVAGRAAKEAYEAAPLEENPGFLPGDLEALDGRWSWVMTVVRPGFANGPGPMIDDDLATVSPWGFAPADVSVPVQLLHGEADWMVPVQHVHRLAALLPAASVRTVPEAGHITILDSLAGTLPWLAGSFG